MFYLLIKHAGATVQQFVRGLGVLAMVRPWLPQIKSPFPHTFLAGHPGQTQHLLVQEG